MSLSLSEDMKGLQEILEYYEMHYIVKTNLKFQLTNKIDRVTGHGAETAMDVNEAMSRKTNEVEFMGLGATATIDLEEPNSNTKGKRQVGTWNMYGSKASQLVKEFASGEKGQLTTYNNDLIREVVAECTQHHLDFQSLIRKMQEEGLDIQTAKNADHYGALIHHLAVVRNKRCLMAYMYNRAEIIRNLLWKIGHVLPQEIKVKLCNTEEEHFKNHSKALKNYMLKVEVDLTVDMVPPKDPYIKVRVIDDIGEGILLKKSPTPTRTLLLSLINTLFNPFIAQNVMLCALSKEEYTKVHNFRSAKKIWDTLAVTYEATS
ncbi:hypothetical protein JHK87_009859 [Glycine soja]|nr:hypothetical protein JHK87_009859 [Glycine soja]